MIRHQERAKRVQDVRLTMTGDFHSLEADYVTENGIRKTLVLSESEASALVAALSDALSERPEDSRAERWVASLQAASK